MGSCLRARAKGASTISATAATMSGGGRMSERDTKTALITGVLGQDGSYLAELLAAKGYRVIGTSHRGARIERRAFRRCRGHDPNQRARCRSHARGDTDRVRADALVPGFQQRGVR